MSTTRREFLQTVAAATSVAAVVGLRGRGAEAQAQTSPAGAAVPWYRRARRWGQTNITEADVEHYDIAWWRGHWKRTAVDGVVVNAGGIVAYYPSKFELHYQPPTLKGRDLFGELVKAAHDDGICVFARMDSSKAHEPLYRAHPDWFAVDGNGQPYRSGEFFLSCISGPYYEEWIPGILREIIERYHPEGFTDNIWAGLDRNQICYCANCQRRFRQFANMALPARRDWNDPAFRKWIEWSYARRIEQWEFNNKATREAGGKDCIWVGMNGADVAGQASSFRDLKEICARAEMIMLDNQSRGAGGLQENAMDGKLVRSVLGWDKLMPESMAMYQHGRPYQYRLTTKSPPEARMWMLSGFAGGIQPWWHHVAAYHEDRRMYKTAEPVMNWHKANEEYLFNRRPVANVAVGWSQRNMDFFGRDNAAELVEDPWRGFTQALVRARIPFLPVHLDYLDRDGGNFSVLVLPNVGLMTDEQVAAVRRFAERGGSIVATGQTGLYDQWGDARAEGVLADLFGVKGMRPIAPTGRGRGGAGSGAAGAGDSHTYLRLTPELRGQVYGPKHGDEPAISGKRHPVLAGLEETDLIEYGGTLGALEVTGDAQVLMTFVPAFPATPPEIVYMRTPKTNLPGMVVREAGNVRAVYFAADLDRRFAVDNFPDHGDLLANAVRWAARDALPLEVMGSGLVDCELYEQREQGRMILHVVNVTSAGSWRPPVHELIVVGPLSLRVRVPQGFAPAQARFLVAGGAPVPVRAQGGWATVDVKSVLDHEVIVIET